MLGIYAIWPFFLCMVLLLIIAASPILKLADTRSHPSATRISTLDGLRGLLALSVFFHHGVIYHQYLLTGVYGPPPSHFYRLLGPFGVDIFFMITGYLFWAILIKNSGQPLWLHMYVGRIFRIGPLYLFAAAATLITIFSYTGLVLKVSHWDFLQSLVRLGLLGIRFVYPINDYKDIDMLIGVTWTLKYEWYFYLSLFITGQVARNKIAHFALPGIILPVLLFSISRHASPQKMVVDDSWICATLFCIGMICASLRSYQISISLPNWLSSIFVIILISATFTFCDTLFATIPIILLGVAFFLIVSGCDIFGLLSTCPARRLSNASYGIYLLQGLFFSWFFSLAPFRRFALTSPYCHWEIIFLCATVLVAFSSLAYFLIEQPGIRLGHLASAAFYNLTRRNHDEPPVPIPERHARRLRVQAAKPKSTRS